MKIYRRQGTRLPPITARAFDAAGFIDLTVFTSGITFKAVGPVTFTGSATGDVDGNLTYDFGATDLNVAGTYAATFTGTDGTGKRETFPTGENITLVVVPAL